ncbi:MAG: Crp/Fnr family transcriptional regulator [Bradyrhizobium sp.]
MAGVQHPNRLLAPLPAAEFELLRPHLKPFEMVQGDLLFDAGDPVNWVYFPHGGVISLVVGLGDGQMIEAAMVGRDGVVGGAAALDGKVALNRGLVQIEGIASILDVGILRKAAERSPHFRTTLIRHEQALFAQAQQSAACNASHTVEARLSRWLLRSRELAGSNTLGLTQEFVAQMLGVRRTSVSLVANTLQNAGLIRYSRGRIQVTNLDGLRAASCECYGRVKAQYDRLLDPETK